MFPPADEISTRLALTSPHQVILDDEQHSVFLTQAGMELDLGAIAKGYIADRVRDFLHSQQVFQGLINLGGNVQTLGGASQMRGTPWSVGLKKPFAGPDDLIGVIEVEGKSVVTSGTYERWFEYAGKRYHHILDPRTGYPLDNELHSVTIVSEDSVDGDIWTTLIYGMGVEQGCACLANKPELKRFLSPKTAELSFHHSSYLRSHCRTHLTNWLHRVVDTCWRGSPVARNNTRTPGKYAWANTVTGSIA